MNKGMPGMNRVNGMPGMNGMAENGMFARANGMPPQLIDQDCSEGSVPAS